MKYKVFAVKDKALDSFSAPFTQATLESGIRMWRDLVMFGEDNNRYKRNPEDFSLYLIGEYDDDLGVMENSENMLVSTATEVLIQTTQEKDNVS